jgi:hypothetical protein
LLLGARGYAAEVGHQTLRSAGALGGPGLRPLYRTESQRAH